MPQEGSLLSHTDNFKCLDVSMDFLEFLLTSVPEAVFDKIEHLLRWLIKLRAQNRGGEAVAKKVRDLLSLSEEMLSDDVMLPNLVAMAGDLVSSASKAEVQPTKLVILETLNEFVSGCTHLD